MVRRGWLAAGATAVVLLAVAACSGDDGGGDDAASSTASSVPSPATLPADAEPGRGYLLLGGEPAVLTVTACAFEAVLDEGTGVTTELAVAAQDPTGRAVDVVRSSFTADVATVTDTVAITPPGEGAEVLEASRAEAGGRFIDLRVPLATGPLLEVDADAGIVRAAGVFGPAGSGPGAEGEVDGELLLRCP